jgi:hypothetical protein
VSATTELVARIALSWIKHRPFSAEAKARRKAKRAARKAARRGEVSQPEEGSSMLSGKLTYTSGIVLALSWLAERFGLPLVAADIEPVVLAVTAAVSAVGVLYGRWRATQKPAA